MRRGRRGSSVASVSEAESSGSSSFQRMLSCTNVSQLCFIAESQAACDEGVLGEESSARMGDRNFLGPVSDAASAELENVNAINPIEKRCFRM